MENSGYRQRIRDASFLFQYVPQVHEVLPGDLHELQDDDSGYAN